ncbi:hypothetical protein ACO0LL_18815 [Undibacterium sp. TC4M20W]|uniref:hypothetical protein n=1 Tax=unclassified Undibacterium TaxID=2630295 RepID=UPI003BF0AE96
MFSLFKKQPPQEPPKTKQNPPTKTIPKAPMEICVPDRVRLEEAPKFSGKTISFLVYSDSDINTIEYDPKEGRVDSSDDELKQFLIQVEESQQMAKIFSQCKAILYPTKEENSLGHLACIQDGKFYSFDLYELSNDPIIKWELHRTVRLVDIEPYGPDNAFKPTPS